MGGGVSLGTPKSDNVIYSRSLISIRNGVKVHCGKFYGLVCWLVSFVCLDSKDLFCDKCFHVSSHKFLSLPGAAQCKMILCARFSSVATNGDLSEISAKQAGKVRVAPKY